MKLLQFHDAERGDDGVRAAAVRSSESALRSMKLRSANHESIVPRRSRDDGTEAEMNCGREVAAVDGETVVIVGPAGGDNVGAETEAGWDSGTAGDSDTRDEGGAERAGDTDSRFQDRFLRTCRCEDWGMGTASLGDTASDSSSSSTSPNAPTSSMHISGLGCSLGEHGWSSSSSLQLMKLPMRRRWRRLPRPSRQASASILLRPFADEEMLSERATDDSERGGMEKMGERGERRAGSSSDWDVERDARWEEEEGVGEKTDRWDVDKECILFWEEGTRKGDVRGRLGLGGAVLEVEGRGGTGGAGRVVDGAGLGDGRVRMDSRDVRRKEAWGASEMGWEGASAVWRRGGRSLGDGG